MVVVTRFRGCCLTHVSMTHLPTCSARVDGDELWSSGSPAKGQIKQSQINPKTRPSRDDVMIQVARTIALRSTCGRLQVGAVITHDGRILSTGYNGAPARLPHCQHDLDEPCARAVHAEANAVAFAARHGISTADAELYTTHDPCLVCAMLIINAGIRTIHTEIKYRDAAGLNLLKDAQVRVLRIQ